LVILVVLATIAVPSFADIIRNNRVTAQSNELLALLWVARSEAVKRKVDVTVAITRPVPGGWTAVVCPQTELTGSVCNSAELIRRSDFEGGTVSISDSGGNVPPFFFIFDDLGRLQYNNIGATHLVLQHQNCVAPKPHRRELSFTPNGSVSISSKACP
jgi:type IV fimbrial biogenesis protein FimT